MLTEKYKGYEIEGFGNFNGSLYEASAAVMDNRKFIGGSGIIGTFETEQDAVSKAVIWAKAWIDMKSLKMISQE